MNKTISYIYVILSAVCWGFIGFSNRLLTEAGMTLGNRVFVRNFGTLLVLTVVFALFHRQVFRIRLKHLPIFLGSGLISILLLSVVYFQCQTMCSLSVAAVLLYLAPSFVVLASAVLAEGCAHTHDKKRYAGRLLLFAVLSELPFNLMCSGQWLSWNYQNVLWTLLIGALVCWAMDWARTRPEMWQRLPADAAIAVGFILGQVCNTDYGGWGVLLVTLFYLTREVRNRWAIQLVGLALFCWFCSAWRLEMLAMLSLIPLYLYNGERGFSNKALQYGFYAFYPVHILILSVLARYAF